MIRPGASEKKDLLPSRTLDEVLSDDFAVLGVSDYDPSRSISRTRPQRKRGSQKR